MEHPQSGPEPEKKEILQRPDPTSVQSARRDFLATVAGAFGGALLMNNPLGGEEPPKEEQPVDEALRGYEDVFQDQDGKMRDIDQELANALRSFDVLAEPKSEVLLWIQGHMRVLHLPPEQERAQRVLQNANKDINSVTFEELMLVMADILRELPEAQKIDKGGTMVPTSWKPGDHLTPMVHTLQRYKLLQSYYLAKAEAAERAGNQSRSLVYVPQEERQSARLSDIVKLRSEISRDMLAISQRYRDMSDLIALHDLRNHLREKHQSKQTRR